MNKTIIFTTLAVLGLLLTLMQVSARTDDRLGVFPVDSAFCNGEDNNGSDIDSETTLIFEQEMEDVYIRSAPGKCIPHWVCSEWTECTDGTQTRACKDTAYCQTEERKPEEQVSCKEESVQDVLSGSDSDEDVLKMVVVDEDKEDNVFKFGKDETQSGFFESFNLLPFVALILIAGLFIFLIFFRKKNN